MGSAHVRFVRGGLAAKCSIINLVSRHRNRQKVTVMSNAKLFTALVKAQAEMGKLLKDSQNLHLKNRYASLAAVLDTCRQPLANNGIVLYQEASTAADMPHHVIVTSTLVHGESGESVTASLPIPLAQNNAQGIGSAITYGRRYLAMAQCGLAPDDEDDDDGNKASGKAQPQQDPAQRQQPAKPQPSAQHRQPTQAPAKPAQVDSEAQELADSVGAVVTVVDAALEKARKAFHAEVVATFPKDDVDHARHWLIKRYTGKTTPSNVRESANDLATDELTALAGVLKSHRKTYADQWIVEKTAPIPASK